MAVGNRLALLYVEIRADATRLHSSLGTIRKRLVQVNKSMTDIARVAKRAFAVSAAAIVGTSFAAARFEKQIAFVSTQLSEATMKFLPEFRKAVRDLSIQFGQSTQAMSKGLYDILSASIAPEKALNVLKVSAIAAVGGFTNVATAADALTTILNSYSIAAENAMIISDKLQALVLKGKVTFEQVAVGIGKVAATSSQAGLSLDDLFAALATTTRAGVKFDQATTAVLGVLRGFLKATEEGKQVFSDLSLQVTGTASVLNTITLKALGLTEVMRILSAATKEQISIMFPNIRGLKALAAVLSDVEGQAVSLDIIMNASGRSMRNFEIANKTVAQQFARTKAAVLALAVGIGVKLLPHMAVLLDKVKSFAESLSGPVIASWLKWIAIISAAIIALKLLIGTLVVLAAHPIIAFFVAVGVAIKAVTGDTEKFGDALKRLAEDQKKRTADLTLETLPFKAMSEIAIKEALYKFAGTLRTPIGKTKHGKYWDAGAGSLISLSPEEIRKQAEKRIKEIAAAKKKIEKDVFVRTGGTIRYGLLRGKGARPGTKESEKAISDAASGADQTAFSYREPDPKVRLERRLQKKELEAGKKETERLKLLIKATLKADLAINNIKEKSDDKRAKDLADKARDDKAEGIRRLAKETAVDLKAAVSYSKLQESKIKMQKDSVEKQVALAKNMLERGLLDETKTNNERGVILNNYLAEVGEIRRAASEKEASENRQREAKIKKEAEEKIAAERSALERVISLQARLSLSILGLQKESRQRDLDIVAESYAAKIKLAKGHVDETLAIINEGRAAIDNVNKDWDARDKQREIGLLDKKKSGMSKRLGFLTGLRGAIESTFMTSSQQRLREINRQETERLAGAQTEQEKIGIKQIAVAQRQAVRGGGAGRFEAVGNLFKRLQSAAANPTIKLGLEMKKLLQGVDVNMLKAANSLESIDTKIDKLGQARAA